MRHLSREGWVGIGICESLKHPHRECAYAPQSHTVTHSHAHIHAQAHSDTLCPHTDTGAYTYTLHTPAGAPLEAQVSEVKQNVDMSAVKSDEGATTAHHGVDLNYI